MGTARAEPLPEAIRAHAAWRTTRVLRRRRRVFTYDARWADGRVERDLETAGRVLQGGSYPADAHVTEHAARDACPDEGTGPWIQYASGLVLDDGADGGEG